MSLAPDIKLPEGVTPALALAMAKRAGGGGSSGSGGVRVTKLERVVPDFTEALLASLVVAAGDAGLTGAVQSEALADVYHRTIARANTPLMAVRPVTVKYTPGAPDGIAPADRARLVREEHMSDDYVDVLANALREKLVLAPEASHHVTDYVVQQTTTGAAVPVAAGEDGHGPVAALIVPVPMEDAAYGLMHLVPFARDFLLGALRRALGAEETARRTVVEYTYGRIEGLVRVAPASRAIYLRLLTPGKARARFPLHDILPLRTAPPAAAATAAVPPTQ
jgi:hypothetical protein